MTREVIVEGVGLHTGQPCRVSIGLRRGAIVMSNHGVEARVDQLEIASTLRATTVQAYGGAFRIATVEHAFAALAGSFLYDGLELAVDGPEMPLLDGGASIWCGALARMGVPPSAPKLRVGRPARITVGQSSYEFAPSDGIDIEVRVEFDDPRLEPSARWRGDPIDFATRIASARTFVMAADIEELTRLGLARQVQTTSVVVIAPDAIYCAGRPFSADEPARHKLVDLVGDLYLAGGPPLGSIRAVRPGHTANAAALRSALREGALVRR